jgi:short subunit dehydrogenase-like uncharacterized protein
MAALYLARRYGHTVHWGIAGRRREALEDVKKACLDACSDRKALEKSMQIFIADSGDEESLRKVCQQTKVVISTAGPFAKVS